MEEEKMSEKLCELCEEKAATVLCAECCKCYCDECNEYMHRKESKKSHKTEPFPDGVVVNAMCPLHKNGALEVFCVDEVKLCCAMCERDKLHEGHKTVKVTEIAEDNEVFSAADVRKRFADAVKSDDELRKRIEEIIESVRREGSEAKEKVTQTFKAEHEKLQEEEAKVLGELERACNESEDVLQGFLVKLREAQKYSEALTEAAEAKREDENTMSRLMELNLASEMERQRGIVEELHTTEMTDLKIRWDDKERKLSFTRSLFNGAPVPSNVRFPKATWREVEIAWDCDVSKMGEKDREEVKYAVEMTGKEDVEVYSGKDRKCSVRDLEPDTEYAVRVRCCAGERANGRWSEKAVVRTQRLPAPSNIRVKSDTTWDSITFTWDVVEGVSSYQIEVDGNRSLERVTTSLFIKRGLLPETEHTFRVRAVRGNSVSEWSDAVKGRTRWRFPETSAWKKCPEYVDGRVIYSVDMKNPRIATKTSDYGWCTIIGNTPLPLNKVTSWNIKILKSKDNDGRGVFIGVAPSDINQNICSYSNCGWYFGCYDSTLYSGPPHNYRKKEYGPRKGDGQYVHTGDSVGVVMSTAKGELSFVLDGVNLGVAYKGIPLDNPLVPCAILGWGGDSVELII